jgi:hypothetical protein
MKSGNYWYRETTTDKPEVVILQIRGGPTLPDGTEYGLAYVWRYAPKPTLGGMFYDNIKGEFWSEALLPPKG